DRRDEREHAEEAPFTQKRDQRRAHPTCGEADVRPGEQDRERRQCEGRFHATPPFSPARTRASSGQRDDVRETGRIERLSLRERAEARVDGLKEGPQGGEADLTTPAESARPAPSARARSGSEIVASSGCGRR